MRRILNDYGCCQEEEKPVLVKNRGSNMITAFRDNRHIHCMNHLIHNWRKPLKVYRRLRVLLSNVARL